MLPGIGRQASAVVLGAAWFGTEIGEDDAFRLMDTFADQGGNVLDTAHMYASWVPGGVGASETTVGKWLRRAGREDVIVGTKGADRGMTREGIRAQLAESLDRLGMDSVDFYWLHSDDPGVPAGDIVEWLNELADEGRLAAFGCSNWCIMRIREAQSYAAGRGLRPFATSQIGFSLGRVNREVLRGGGQVYMADDILAYHRSSGLAIVAYSSQAGGFFAGNYDPAGPPPGVEPNPNIVRLYGTPDNYARLAEAKKISAARGCSANQVALAYVLTQSFPSFAIAGANSPERVVDSCGAADVALTAHEVQRLESPS